MGTGTQTAKELDSTTRGIASRKHWDLILPLLPVLAEIAHILGGSSISPILEWLLVGLTVVAIVYGFLLSWRPSKLQGWVRYILIAALGGACFMFYGIASSPFGGKLISWPLAGVCAFSLLCALNLVPGPLRGRVLGVIVFVSIFGLLVFAKLRLVPSCDSPPAPYLRVHAPRTIGVQLAPALAKAFLVKLGAPEAALCKPPANQDEIIVVGTIQEQNKPVAIEIEDRELRTSLPALDADRCQVAIGPQFGPKSKAPLSTNVLATDALAIIVSKDNSLVSLSRDEIHDIFVGNRIIWRDLPRSERPDDPVNVYSMKRGSDEWGIFDARIMHGSELDSTVRMLDSIELVHAIATDPNAIGFVPLSSLQRDNIGVKTIQVDGTPPSEHAIATWQYPLSYHLYLFTKSTVLDNYTKSFVNFALQEGQEVVKQSGFFSRDLELSTTTNSGSPERHKQLTTNAALFLPIIHFDPNMASIRSKDIKQIDRVLTNSPHDGQKVMVLGFADASGREGKNLYLSENRARAVMEELKKYPSIKVAIVEWFGSRVPFNSRDPQDAPETKAENRRVEIWACDASPACP